MSNPLFTENISWSVSRTKIFVIVSCPCFQGTMCVAVVLSSCTQFLMIGHQRLGSVSKLGCSDFWTIVASFRKFPWTVVSWRPLTTTNPFGHRVKMYINHLLGSLMLGLWEVTRSACLRSSIFCVWSAFSSLIESTAERKSDGIRAHVRWPDGSKVTGNDSPMIQARWLEYYDAVRWPMIKNEWLMITNWLTEGGMMMNMMDQRIIYDPEVWKCVGADD